MERLRARSASGARLRFWTIAALAVTVGNGCQLIDRIVQPMASVPDTIRHSEAIVELARPTMGACAREDTGDDVFWLCRTAGREGADLRVTVRGDREGRLRTIDASATPRDTADEATFLQAVVDWPHADAQEAADARTWIAEHLADGFGTMVIGSIGIELSSSTDSVGLHLVVIGNEPEESPLASGSG